LNDGTVLVVGGETADGISNTVERFDPSRNIWEPMDALAVARVDHTATLLGNGDVLIVGGRGSSNLPLRSAERYVFSRGEWEDAGTMPAGQERAAHAAVRLPSGRVLVAGGGVNAEDGLATSLVYGPPEEGGTGWTVTGSMSTKRNTLTLSVVGGVAIAVGGYDLSGSKATSEKFSDAPSNTWGGSGSTLGGGRQGHAATVLERDGSLLVTGSLVNSASGTISKTSTLYSPKSDAWSTAQDMRLARFAHTASYLSSSGAVLVTGGFIDVTQAAEKSTNSAELYTAGGGWTLISPMNRRRAQHTATVLQSGEVLIVGGLDPEGEPYVAETELYVP